MVDGNLITSRKPEDIPAFTKALIEALEADDADDAETHDEAEADENEVM